MGRVIAIDPGACNGYAIFYSGALVFAGVFKGEDIEELPRQAFMQFSGGFALDLVVIEKPVIYPLDTKGDPNQLITLAIRAGEIAGRFRYANREVEWVKPRTWKGTAPKDITNRRTLAKLTDEEKECLPRLPKTKAHNMLDAIGIGLWYLEKKRIRT